MSRPDEEKFFWRKDFREDSSGWITDSDSPGSEELRVTGQSSQQRQLQQYSLSSIVARPGSRLFAESKLVIGIPAHNSEKSLARTVVKLRSLDVDIIVCDDFSSDLTEEIAREMRCKVIKHPKELGVSDSVTSLFLASRRLRADNLLTVDVEMDFTLRDTLNLLERVQSGECDIAIGTDLLSDGETKGQIGDPYSVLRAYGRRALALIAPAGTTSVVPEIDVLEFAKQQGLKVKEYLVSSAGRESFDEQKNFTKMMKSVPSKIESVLSRTLSAALDHPLLLLGTPAIGMLAAAGIQTVEALQLWNATGIKPDFGFYYAGFDLVVSLILGVGALILESQNLSRNKVRMRTRL